MRKYRLVIAIDDDTYPIDDLRDMIESEGITVESLTLRFNDRRDPDTAGQRPHRASGAGTPEG